MVRYAGIVLALWWMSGLAAAADRPILLITPAGVWQSTVTNNVPGPFVKISADVIVQGFGSSPGPGPTPDPPKPDPPTVDPVTAQVAAISQRVLKNVSEATACAALVDSLTKAGLTGKSLTDAMVQAAPILDAGLKSGGRVAAWVAEVVNVTPDPAKIIQGLVVAWNVKLRTLELIQGLLPEVAGSSIEDIQKAVSEIAPDQTEQAIDIAMILLIIQAIMNLLKALGIIK